MLLPLNRGITEARSVATLLTNRVQPGPRAASAAHATLRPRAALPGVPLRGELATWSLPGIPRLVKLTTAPLPVKLPHALGAARRVTGTRTATRPSTPAATELRARAKLLTAARPHAALWRGHLLPAGPASGTGTTTHRGAATRTFTSWACMPWSCRAPANAR